MGENLKSEPGITVCNNLLIPLVLAGVWGGRVLFDSWITSSPSREL